MMKKRYIYLLLTVLYILAGSLCRAQENTMVRTRELADTLTIYFPLNQYTFDPSYMGNKVNMDRFIELNGVQNIVCRVTSSPEGPLSRNSFLTKMRAQSVADYINSHYDVSDDQVEISTADEAWEELEVLVRGSQMPWKDDVLAIFQNSPDTKKIELQRYDDGKVWEWMKDNWFPRLRQTLIIVKTKEEKEVALIAKVDPPVGEIDLSVPESPGLEYSPRVVTRPWERQLHLKTNLIGWGMGHINIAAEIDLAPHWSLAIPFYYSGGFDYFKSTLKFRGIVLQPEARYYLKGNDGFYVGAHLGLGWYNFALGGEFRIQDHKGRTPAYGGGLGLGYAMNFKKNPRWGMEFALGGGVYKAKYDVFFNENNGPYEDTAVEKVFFGLDNVSVAFTYSFNIRKEGRR